MPFTTGSNPNLPVSDSPNFQRVLGRSGAVEPIISEPGDIWPGKVATAPTLQDLEQNGNVRTQPEMPVPGSPLSRGTLPSPNPAPGSSSPPGSNAPGLAPLTTQQPLSSYKTPATTTSPSGTPATGSVVQTPGGPSVVTGGTPSYQTTTGPGGAQSIVVPNGNGTSTVIHPDGRIETIPTPK